MTGFKCSEDDTLEFSNGQTLPMPCNYEQGLPLHYAPRIKPIRKQADLSPFSLVSRENSFNFELEESDE